MSERSDVAPSRLQLGSKHREIEVLAVSLSATDSLAYSYPCLSLSVWDQDLDFNSNST